MKDRLQQFAAALGTIQAELDWPRLGRAYCEGDGTGFFDDELRERWLDTGLRVADALSVALHGRAPGRSLYVGAALAELPVMLVEQIVLGREVAWANVDCDEVDELARAVRLASARLGTELPLPSTAPLSALPAATFDHVWMASVLTDPDHFPALHDELYERRGTPLATGRGSLADDRERAGRLADLVLERAAPGALVTTTDEELVLLAPRARARGIDLVPLGEGIESAIVGDVVRILRATPTDAPSGA